MNSYVLIDTFQIIKNINKINKKVMLVVKSDAYGMGLNNLIKYFKKSKVDFYCFNRYTEYLNVIDDLNEEKILIFESPNCIYNKNIRYTINNYKDALFISSIKDEVYVHIQIDTKMNRLGIKDIKEFNKVMNLLKQHSNIIIEGIYTHLISRDKDIINCQIERFKEFLIYPFEVIHVASSSNIDLDFGTHVRVGAYIYLNAVKVISHLENIIEIDKKESVGYNNNYIALNKELIGVIPLGYYEGFSEEYIYANGLKYQVIGDICMNHSFIKIDNKINKYTDLLIWSSCDKIGIEEIHRKLIGYRGLTKKYKE